jgi:drug/metabolite transporter (DMT)-like permease
MHKKSFQAYILFLLFAIFWGAAFPITKSAIKDINLYLFLFLRFIVAAIVMIPLIWRDFTSKIKTNIRVGIILGLLNTAIYSFETLSLHYTSVARAAFISGANVILVPFISKIMKIGKLHPADIISGLAFLIGLYILTGVHLGTGADIGSLFALLSALFIAISIVYVHRVTCTDNKFDEKILTFFQIIFATPIPLLILLFHKKIIFQLNFNVLWGIIFCALFATTIPLFGQIKFQKYTSATVTALIFALEPVFASVVAYLFYHAQIPSNEIIGGSIMLISTALPNLQHLFQKTKLG